MKAFRVACVVSALTATASGVSITASAVKLSDTPQKFDPSPSAQMANRRRSIRWPLPRLLKRAQTLKQKYRTEKRDLFSRQLESQLSAFTYRTSSALPEAADADYPQLNRMQLTPPNDELTYPSFEARISDIPSRAVQNSIPGFVEVAVPDPKAGRARTVSGLAYSLSPDSDSDYELGTSGFHSTQFLLSPMESIDGTYLYRLKAPVPAGSNANTVEQCATFATTPSAPLSMKKCGEISGFSQRFSYDQASGELKPVYQNSVLNKENISTNPINKRQHEELSTHRLVSSPPTKRATSESSQSSAVLFFVPAADVNKSL